MVLGALNWASEWWNPRRGSLEVVVRTAQSLVRHGLAARQADGNARGGQGGRGARIGGAQAPGPAAGGGPLKGQTASTRTTVAVRGRCGAIARPISASAAPETCTPGIRASCRPRRRGRRGPGVTSLTR